MEKIKNYLIDDEIILWSERPNPQMLFSRLDRYAVPLGNIFFSKPLEENPFSFSLAVLKEAMGFYGLKKNRIAFESIQNVDEVYKQILSLKAK